MKMGVNIWQKQGFKMGIKETILQFGLGILDWIWMQLLI